MVWAARLSSSRTIHHPRWIPCPLSTCSHYSLPFSDTQQILRWAPVWKTAGSAPPPFSRLLGSLVMRQALALYQLKVTPCRPHGAHAPSPQKKTTQIRPHRLSPQVCSGHRRSGNKVGFSRCPMRGLATWEPPHDFLPGGGGLCPGESEAWLACPGATRGRHCMIPPQPSPAAVTGAPPPPLSRGPACSGCQGWPLCAWGSWRPPPGSLLC